MKTPLRAGLLRGALPAALALLLCGPARAQVLFSTGSQSGLRMYFPGSNDWWLDPSGGRLDVRANGGSPLASFAAGGNVGIGTTNPSQTLDVAGAQRLAGDLRVDPGGNTPFIVRRHVQPTGGSGWTAIHSGTMSTGIFARDAGGGAFFYAEPLLGGANTDGQVIVGAYGSGSGAGSNSIQFYTRNAVDSMAERMRVTSAGNVGIGTTNPTAALQVNGSIVVSGCTGCGSGTSQWTTAGANIHFNTGNVGIGLTNPAAKLDVGGGEVYIDNNQYYRGRQSGGVAYALIGMDASNVIRVGSDNPALAFYTGGGAVERMRIDAGGNVGVGTGASRSTFTAAGNLQLVAGSTLTANGTLSISTAASAAATGMPALFITKQGQVGIGRTDPAAKLDVGASDIYLDNNQFLRGRQTGGGIYQLIGMDSNNIIRVGSDNPTLIFLTGGGAVERMRIDNGGNVGIGTTNPAAILHAEAAEPELSLKATRVDNGKVVTAWNLQSHYNVSAGSASLNFAQNASIRMTLDPNGSLGVGTKFPGGKLGVHGTGTSYALIVSTDSSGGSGNLVVANSGLVGIGTTNPGYVLDVRGGNIRFGDTAATMARVGSYSGGTFFSSDSNGLPMSFFTTTSGGSFGERLRIDSAGNVGIGTTNPTAPLHVNGAIIVSGCTGCGSGTSQWTTAGSNIHFNTGNVGIGTTNPAAPLAVTPTTDSQSKIVWYDDGSFAGGISKNSGDLGAIFVKGTNANFKVKGSATYAGALTDLLTVQPTGNVGIGTAAPGANLDISTAGSGRQFLYISNASGGLNVGKESSAGGSIVAGSAPNAGVIGTNTSAPLHLETGGAVRMTLDGAGAIGIGTTSPAAKLHLSSGALTIDGTGPGLSVGGATFVVANGKVGIGTVPTAGFDINAAVRFQSNVSALSVANSTNIMNLGDAGNIGLGGSTGDLGINADKNFYLATQGYNFIFRNYTGYGTGSNNVVIQSDGNVGIGSASPNQLLTVAGSNATGNGIRAFISNTNGTSGQDRRAFLEVVGNNNNDEIALVGGRDASNNSYQMVGGSSMLQLGVGGSEKVRVAASGNVGIGTTNPGTFLHLLKTGSPEILVETTDTTSPGLTLKNTARAWNLSTRADSQLYIRDNTAAADRLIINASGNVGIGNTNPLRLLDISGTGSGVYNPAGSAAFQGLHAIRIVNTNATVGNAVGIHFASYGADEGTLAFVNRGGTTNQGDFVFHLRNDGSRQEVMRLVYTGNVGIGTSAPDQLLSVNGNASKSGGGSWATFSDARLKNIGGSFTPGLREVLQLKPLRYHYKDDNPLGIRNLGEHVGFSAQEVQKVIPEAVSRSASGYLMMESDPILWAMLNAIKEQQQRIEALQRELDALRSERLLGQ